MNRLLAGLRFERVPRVVGYAVLAALVATGLLAADGAYRHYHDTSMQVAAPATPAPSVDAAEPAPAEAQLAHSPSLAPAPVATPDHGIIGIAERPETLPDAGFVPNPASGSIPIPAARPTIANAAVPDEAAPEPAQSKVSAQPKPQQARRIPAKQTTRDRTSPRRPVQAATRPAPAERAPAQAAKPNVYYERDSQLGFAPQLRKRTCNPATGQMPMQCYYPREGRERFPAKPVE